MCTGIRFADARGNMFFGRNLDWSVSYGEQVVVTPRGYVRPWAFEEPSASDHGVIGMGIVAEGIPLYFDCANEAGLAIAGLNFPGYAQYEDEPLEDAVNVAAYEFPLWVTSLFESVDQVEKALKDVALVGKPVNEAYPVSMLHWLIGDGRRSIVVEYTAAGMRVYRDYVDVLANQPAFPWHSENLRNYLSLTNEFPKPAHWRAATLKAYGSGAGMRGIPGDYYSPSRFVRAAYLNARYPQQDSEGENVLRLFHTLGGVSMIDGAAMMADGAFEKTIYTGGYSADTRTYYFSVYDDPAIKCVSMADCNLQGAELLFPEPHVWSALA